MENTYYINEQKIMLNPNKFCRFCLDEKNYMNSIPDLTEIKISNLYKIVTEMDLEVSNDYPQLICNDCESDILTASIIRKRLIETDKFWKTFLKNHKIQKTNTSLSTNEIKIEEFGIIELPNFSENINDFEMDIKLNQQCLIEDTHSVDLSQNQINEANTPTVPKKSFKHLKTSQQNINRRHILKRKTISLGEKINILDRLKMGERSTAVAKTLGLNEATVRTIKNNEDKIRTSVAAGSSISAKKASHSRDIIKEEMEKLLMIWIQENNKKQVMLGSYTIKKKAIKIYKCIKDSDKSLSDQQASVHAFSASQGWFINFKKRFSLQNVFFYTPNKNNDC